MFYKHNVSTLDYIVSPPLFFASMCSSAVRASPWLILIEQVPLFIFIFPVKSVQRLEAAETMRSAASSKKSPVSPAVRCATPRPTAQSLGLHATGRCQGLWVCQDSQALWSAHLIRTASTPSLSLLPSSRASNISSSLLVLF